MSSFYYFFYICMCLSYIFVNGDYEDPEQEEYVDVVSICELNQTMLQYINNGSDINTNKTIQLQSVTSTTVKNLNKMKTFNNITKMLRFKPATLRDKKDFITELQKDLDIFLFGFDAHSNIYPLVKNNERSQDPLTFYPSGRHMHADQEAHMIPGAHLATPDSLSRDHSYLKITEDKMQTALNAFYMLTHGSINDIRNMPADYILNSAKTISMMKVSLEKKVATWEVVKAGKHPIEVDYILLEKFRPLFRFVNSREIASLNLSDPKILTYVGTHPGLNRHQVGVVAHKYINMNPDWMKPKIMNMMYNLLCGVPIIHMKNIPINSYLQLNHQVFYHINACDVLQRRFFLSTMTKSKALGKSYSWTARDVARLGYLMVEVKGSELKNINPKALAGLDAQVMEKMKMHNLVSLTPAQTKYLTRESLNIYAMKQLKE